MGKKIGGLLLSCVLLLGSVHAAAVTAEAATIFIDQENPAAAGRSIAYNLRTLPETGEETAPEPPTEPDPSPEIPPVPEEPDPVPPPTPEEPDPVPPPVPEEPEVPTPSVPEEETAPVIPPVEEEGNGGGDVAWQEPAAEAVTTLSDLHIACGDLVPVFSPDHYEYTVYVTADQVNRSCEIEAVPQDPAAQVSVTGPDSFDKKEITRTVTVSNGGSETKYTITVHVLGAAELLLDGVLYAASNTPDVDALPENFTAGTFRIGEQDVSMVQSGDGQLLLAQFVSQTDGAVPYWYRYDAQAGKFFPVKIVEHGTKKYVQIAAGKDMLYGSQDGQGVYYVYDQQTGEWLYQTGAHKGLALQPEKRNAPMLVWVGLIVAVVWAVLATVLGCWMYQRNKKNAAKKEEQIYFRPHFTAVDDETIQTATEETT